MTRFPKQFERIIVVSLITMMMVVVLISTAELAWIIIQDIITPPIILLGIEELIDIFGFFLLILIGVELLDTIKAYLDTKVVHVEIVLEVAVIAIARKVITLDPKDYPGLTLVGVAAMIMALAGAFYCFKKLASAQQH